MKLAGKIRPLLALCCFTVIGLALQGCREEEQDRILYFDKGHYLGTQDEGLTDSQVDALRSRARDQRF